MIQAGNAAVEGNGSWRRASAYIERKERERTQMLKKQVPFGIGGGALMIVAGFWVWRYTLLFWGIGWMLQSVFIIGYQRYRARKLAVLASSSDDILNVAQRELSQRYFFAVSGLVVALMFAVLYLGNAFGTPPDWFPSIWHRAPQALYLIFGGCFLVVAGLTWTRTMPRLRRERTRLE